MEKILEEMMEYICDKRCRFPNEVDQEELDGICGRCAMNGYIDMLAAAQKEFAEENRQAGYKHGYLDGYTKAIDEFVGKIEQESLNDWIFNLEDAEEYENFIDEIRGISEYLKRDK